MKENTLVLYKWLDLHQKCFEELIFALNEAKIRYFILRNYELLPEKNISKDVDMVIEPGFWGKVENIFKNILISNEISNFYLKKYEKTHSCYGMDINKEFVIHIDFIEGIWYKGFEIFDFDMIYYHTHIYKNFRVLDDDFDVVMFISCKLAGSKKLKEVYRDKISSAFERNQQSVESLLVSLLGNLGCELCSDISNSEFDSLENKAMLIMSMLKRRTFLKHPIKTIYDLFMCYIEKIYQNIFKPLCFSKLIVVEAPDGTGKTTFIDNFTVKLAYYFVSELERSKIYHFRPTILPNLGAVGEKMGAMKQDVNFTNPHRAKPVGGFSSFLRMFYYWLDYVIGIPIILSKFARFDKMIIFDRYIYDFLIDPKRSRISLPYWMRKMFVKLVKSPSLVFVLKTDSDTIYNRKQELEKEEIERQLKEFDKLSNLNKNVYFLDASKTPEEISNDAIRIFMNKFTERLVYK